MTGIFEIWLKKPKEGEVVILPPEVEKQQKFPDMKDSDRFDYEHIGSVEMVWELENKLFEFFREADFCEEFIVRCELPV